MYELKRISKAAIPGALSKAERYRLLNEPAEAESICLDVLATDPENQQALVTLLLALTDGFDSTPPVDVKRATEVVGRLRDPYERQYYAGIVHERWARALLGKAVPAHISLGWIREAMRAYERAEAESPAGNEDAILRWNACVRMLEREGPAESAVAEVRLTVENDHGDEMPVR
jgi:hypothetical protein